MSIAEKLVTIAGNEQKVYEAGQNAGYAQGEEAGYSTGYAEGSAPMEDFRTTFVNRMASRGCWDGVMSGMFAHWTQSMFEAILPFPEEGTEIDGEYYPRMFFPQFAECAFENCDYPVAYKDSGLPSIENMGYAHVTRMYYGCTFTELPGVFLAEGGTGTYTFANAKCTKILKIAVDSSSSIGTKAFYNCTNLESIDAIETYYGDMMGLCEPWDLHWSTNLNVATMKRIINALATAANAGLTNPVLTLGTTNLAKLTDAEKAVATQKGWTLA